MESIFRLLSNKFIEWVNYFQNNLPYLITSVIIIFVSVIIAKIVKKITFKIFNKFFLSTVVSKLISNIIYISIIIIGLIIALGILKLEKTVTSLLAGAGLIGLALGFAFQDLVTNIISGVLIAVRKPFKLNDLIETNGFFGRVRDIRLRTTELLDLDGQVVYIPSREVIQKPLKNYSQLGKRRVVLKIGISYSEDLEKVKEIVLQTVNKFEFILKDNPIEFFYYEFGESSINFIVRFWIKYEREPDYKNAVSESIIAIKKLFDENNIVIPFPIWTLDFDIKNVQKIDTDIIKAKNLGDQNQK